MLTCRSTNCSLATVALRNPETCKYDLYLVRDTCFVVRRCKVPFRTWVRGKTSLFAKCRLVEDISSFSVAHPHPPTQYRTYSQTHLVY